MSTKIKLTYNPFAQKSQRTLLEYNGKLTAIEEGSSFFKCNEQPLQHWINQFFSDVKKEFNTRNVEFEFTGIEADCADVALAIEKAKADGFNISAKFNPQKITAKEVLASLENIRHSIENEPLFNQYIVGNEKYKTLTDNTFDICVVATVSAGKSTFINALLGCDLLPSNQRATTATITEIHYGKEMKKGLFSLARYLKNKEQPEEELTFDVENNLDELKRAKQVLKSWNEAANRDEDYLEKTEKIVIKGNLGGVHLKNEIKLRIFDTPGPNNAKDENHQLIAREKIRNSETNPLVLYLLDVRSSTDDKNLLTAIKEQINEQGLLGQERFLFLLNKMDQCFQDDDMSEAIEEQKENLIKNGIFNPRILPISAQIAKVVREKDLGYSTASRGDLGTIEDLMDKDVRDLNRYNFLLKPSIRQRLDQMEDSPLYRSGIPALELVLTDYIEKYYDLYRIDRIWQAINIILEATTPSLKQLQSLKGASEKELEEIQRKIEEAQNKLALSNEVEKFINELKAKEVALSDVSSEFFTAQQNKMFTEILSVGKKFTTTDSKETADKLIEELKQKISHFYQMFVVELEKVDRQEQQNVLADLHQQYELFANTFIDGKIDIQFAQGFKQQMKSLDNYFAFADLKKYTSVKKIAITKRVEWFSTWNILSWGDRKVVGYRNQTMINLKEYWKEFMEVIEPKLVQDIRSLSSVLKEKSKRLTEDYANELNWRFLAKLKELNETLKEQVKADDLQEQIQQAEEDLNKAAAIKAKLIQLTQPF